MTNKKKNLAILVEDIDKSFLIPDEKISSLKAYFTNPLNLFKSKGTTFEALKDISFQIRKGEFVGIIGRNGSGKSTLLKLIAGIYSPDKGRIQINGSLVPFLELGVGFNPELSARENVFLNGAILGMTRKFLQQKLDEIIGFAEIRKFADTPIKNFSSGMVVRLAFAIAIQAKADIYLLDEVLSVGDVGFKRKSMEKIQELIDSGATVLYVSHDLNTIERLTERVLFLKEGQLVEDGNPTQVVENFHLSMLSKVEREKYLKAKAKLKERESQASINTKDVQEVAKFVDLNTDTGDGRARITSVEIVDKNGKATSRLRVGENFKIIFKANIFDQIENPVAYLGLRRDPSYQLLEINTARIGQNKIKSLKKNDRLEVHFQIKNSLNPGEYYLRAHLGDPEINNKGTNSFASLFKAYMKIEVYEEAKGKHHNWSGPTKSDFTYKANLN